jgi:hypothetical protein
MAAGFRVNLEALDEAADGVNGTIEAFSRQQVSDIPFQASAAGNQELADSLADFLTGWQRGVQNLVIDAESVASRLAESAADYAKADKSIQRAANTVFQGDGTDPGTR